MINIKAKKPILCVGCDKKKKAVIGILLLNEDDNSFICKEYICLECFFEAFNLRKQIIQKANFKRYQLLKFKEKGVAVPKNELEKLRIISEGKFKIV